MDRPRQAHLAAHAKVIRALAHPSRLLIIEELSEKDRCVGELRALIGADVSTVSKHLLVLKAAGIVQDRKQGTQVYYRLRVPCILKFFGCIEAVLETDTQAKSDFVKAIS